MTEQKGNAVQQEKASRPAPRKKSSKKRKTEKNSFRYMCVLFALIVVITAVFCISLDKRNDSFLTESTTQKAESTTGNGQAAPQNTDGTTKTPQTTSSAATAAPETTQAIPVAAKPGTIQNPTIITINEEKWHLTLVNSCYRIPDDYEPDLVYVCESGERLDRKVAEHYEKMYEAALKDGVTLTPCSGYRSYETQERNYNNKVSFYESQGYSTEDAKVKAATIIMPPGSSEHNLGYAMDILCVEEWFEDTEQFAWLTEHAADYGFIMRYPEDKQDITKVIYEPWHWRYVGVELAKELKSNGQVLEEYMGVA